MKTATPTTETQRANRPRWWQGWLPLLLLPACVLLFAPANWPRWVFMWLLAFVIYFGCKWMTWRRRTIVNSTVWKHLGYLLAWPGLDADAFLNLAPLPVEQKPNTGEWLFAVAKMLLGLLLFFGIARCLPNDWLVVRGWIGMAGIIFILHFGSFHVLSCTWRSLGAEAKPLMQWPIAATSLSEFWGKRWNTAFRDLTHRFLFRPLTIKLGAGWALFFGFVFSGLVHDLVITVPAGWGYGGPTLFFLLQGTGILVERSRLGKKIGLGRKWRSWLFTFIMLVLPAPLLFSPVFVRRIVVPFMHDLGAL